MPLILDASNIDTSYDHLFEERHDLTWLPWIGKKFNAAKKRTLILGESTYNWSPKNEQVIERIKSKDHLRILHQNHALQINRKSKYVRNIERAIFQSKNPLPADKEMLWSTVAYHNLVLRPMATLKHRPNYNDYSHGWGEVLNLSSILDIDQCLVYGLEKDKIKSLLEIAKRQNIPFEHKKISGIGKSRSSVITMNISGRPFKFIFIRHPSAFFSWKNWGAFLKNENLLPF
jgi:hypothetical protein